jgi:hypothetical protein
MLERNTVAAHNGFPGMVMTFLAHFPDPDQAQREIQGKL